MEGRRVSPLHISPGRDQLHPRFPSAVLGQIPQQGREHRGAGGLVHQESDVMPEADHLEQREKTVVRPRLQVHQSHHQGEGPLPAHHLIPGDELLQQGDPGFVRHLGQGRCGDTELF